MDDIQMMLQDAAEALMGDAVTPAVLRHAEQGGFDQALWAQLGESGFTQALVREEAGGSGLAWRQVQGLVHAAGRHLLPLPLPETLLANFLLDRAGCAVPDPATCLTVARVDAAMILSGNGEARVAGRLAGVPFAGHARRIVVAADVQGVPHVGWFERDAPGVSECQGGRPHAGVSIAREPRDDLALEAVRLQEFRPAAGLGQDAVWRHGALLRAGQMAGAMDRALAHALAYAADRIQFGRPLGKFQAIQHHLAEAGCEVAAAAMAASHAFQCIDAGHADLAVASAKVRTGRAAGRVAALTHAVHGAIGFTTEHPLHHATRRLWSWRSEYGSHAWWSARIGRALCAEKAPHWWEVATSGHLHLDLEREIAT